MNESMQAKGNNKRISRRRFLQLLNAALDAKSYRFGRQAAIAWLTIYPGDLETLLKQAQFMAYEGKLSAAYGILDRLISLDPEFESAYEVMAQLTYKSDAQRFQKAISALAVLGTEIPGQYPLESWAEGLSTVRRDVDVCDPASAEKTLTSLLEQPDLPLLAFSLNLDVVRFSHDVQTIYRLANLYHNQYPDCLRFSLVLADVLMETGNEPEAVRLLHQCMSNDAAGQVALRLWGSGHAYQSIWPEEYSLYFDLPVPAEILSQLGENWLPAGNVAMVSDTIEVEAPLSVEMPGVDAALEPQAVEEAVENVSEPVSEAGPQPANELIDIPDVIVETAHPSSRVELPMDPPVPEPENTAAVTQRTNITGRRVTGQEAAQVSAEFEKLARKLKKPIIGRADGRFPVYVLFSTRKGLAAQYGPQTAGVVDADLQRFGAAVRAHTGWDAIVYYPDDAKSTANYGLQPVSELDPWKLKLALADLDKALAKKGEMIGMLLIVGGPDVVPFHELPNPTDDFDGKITSDNPYSTLDSNYFVPEWPVGRLPGEVGPDAGLLLQEIRSMIAYHNESGRMMGFPIGGLFWSVLSLFKSIFKTMVVKKDKPNIGYTASVWKRSSIAVFKPVGTPSNVLISPPEVSGAVDVERLLAPEIGYFNLHGMEDGAEWYGQRDPSEPGQGPDYPVALSPKELKKNGHSPRMIFSEACYGANIANKKEESAMSLKFLSLGTLVVVGSTCIAYGAVNTPLVAADLLGNIFWQSINSGKTAGEAFMAAKVELAREMTKRQGALDAEDQKTLLSFVLYGDPMASMDMTLKQGKSMLRLKKHAIIKTVAETPVEMTIQPPVSLEVLNQVKHMLSSYLPGVDTAEVHMSKQSNPSNREDVKNAANGSNNRYVVTLSKQIPIARSVHRHYARATVDKNGRVLKLVVSR